FINEDGNLSDKITEKSNETFLERVYHETVKKVTEDFDNLHFNTAISQMMVFINEGYKAKELPKDYVEGSVKLLSPIAPHICEELWNRLGHSETITYEPWPECDEAKLVEGEVEIVLRVIGNGRAKMSVAKDTDKKELEKKALDKEKLQEWIDGKTVRKV